MSQRLIDHSPDLKMLKLEGYEVQIKQNVLLVSHIPYVNSDRKIKLGILASPISLQSNDLTDAPANHVVFFQGEYPCDKEGKPIQAIMHGSAEATLVGDFMVQHSFSNRPPDGYPDFYQKMKTYADMISAPAISMDDSMTAKTFRVMPEEDNDSPFLYIDSHSARAEINFISDKLKGQKIAIIGLGGTGSYILDFISKTLVAEIHLYDGDLFSQHNAFRAPGAASNAELDEQLKKVAYFERIYSKMRSGIIAHPYRMTAESFHELLGFTMVFVSVDKGSVKPGLFDYLTGNGIPFIDAGIGVQNVNNALLGALRATTGTPKKNDHLTKRISMADDENADLYASNIQIGELNALNATLAVIKWKKMFGFYIDQEQEHHSIYSISESLLLNEDFTAPVC